MRKTKFAVTLLAIAFPMMLAAQTTPKVKHEAAPQISSSSGKEMFQRYCTPCHGQSGQGNGPAASAMRVPPANLTRLAANHGGNFPGAEVAQALRAGPTPTSNANVHGSETMPIWGRVFSALSNQDNALVELRIHNLVEYRQSIQEK